MDDVRSVSSRATLQALRARFFPGRFVAWKTRGLSTRASTALASAGVDTVEQVAQLGRSYFEGLPNCGAKTITELAMLANWPPKTPEDAIAAALSLSVADAEQAREAAADAVVALRKSGFTIAVRRTRRSRSGQSSE
jgi:hypothetical protein